MLYNNAAYFPEKLIHREVILINMLCLGGGLGGRWLRENLKH